jgi:hypothetical protein
MASHFWTRNVGESPSVVNGPPMLRLVGLIFAAALIAALFGPRRLRAAFWAVAALALVYTLLRLAGILPGPRPHGMG